MNPSVANCPTEPLSTRYWIEAGRGLRIEEYHGPIDLEDWKSMISASISDPAHSHDHHQLADFTAARLELSTNDVVRLGLMLRRLNQLECGWQIFVVGSSRDFGTIRMLARWARSEGRLQIFNQRQHANAWLARHGNTHPFRVPERPTEMARERISA